MMTLPLILLVTLGANTEDDALKEYAALIAKGRPLAIKQQEQRVAELRRLFNEKPQVMTPEEQRRNPNTPPGFFRTKNEASDYSIQILQQGREAKRRLDEMLAKPETAIPEIEFTNHSLAPNVTNNVANVIRGELFSITPNDYIHLILRGNVSVFVSGYPADAHWRDKETVELRGIFWVTGKSGGDGAESQLLFRSFAQVKTLSFVPTVAEPKIK